MLLPYRHWEVSNSRCRWKPECLQQSSMRMSSRGLIDRKLVSGRNRIQQKGIVCQKENRPLCCGFLRGGQNEEKAMTRALGTDNGQSPEVKAEKGISGRRVREEEA